MIECLMMWPKAGRAGFCVSRCMCVSRVLFCVRASLMTHFKSLRPSPLVDRHHRRTLTALNGAPGGGGRTTTGAYFATSWEWHLMLEL